MEVYARVRRAVQVDGMSIRQAAREFGLARKTIRKMLQHACLSDQVLVRTHNAVAEMIVAKSLPFAIAFLLVCAPIATAGTNYCAFEIKVTEPSGTPAAKVPVAIIYKDTQIAEARTDESGTAWLCDAPLDAVNIAVGFDICGSVLLKKIRPLWLRTRQVSITYARSSCEEFIFAKSCHLLLRAEDDRGRPVAGARFEAAGSWTASELGLSDSFGRFFLSLKGAEEVRGLVTKRDYEPASVSQTCDPRDDPEMEVRIVLRKR